MLTFISTNFFKSKLLSLFTYSWATVLAKMGMSQHELHATGPAHCADQHVECLVKPDHLVADLHQGELVQASTTSRLARIGVPWRSIKSCTISTPLCRFLYSACNAIRFLYKGCPTKLSHYDYLYFVGRHLVNLIYDNLYPTFGFIPW